MHQETEFDVLMTRNQREKSSHGDGASAVQIGGRKVVAFATVEEEGELTTIYPIPLDGRQGFTFSGYGDAKTSITVHGVEESCGERIAEKYRSGDLPAEEVSWGVIYDDE